MRKAHWIVILILAATFLLFLANFSLTKKERFSTTTAYSSSATGLNLFFRLMSTARPNSVKLMKNGFFSTQDLQGFQTIAILSPEKPVSKREADIIGQFVRSGGKLLVSFHNSRSQKQLESLFSAINIDYSTTRRPEFKNRELTRASPAKDSQLFKHQESYAFYGYLGFAGANCSANTFDCFVRMAALEKGEVILIAGIPIISNALLTESHNANLAFRLIDWAGSLLIDEYHHHFSEKTFLSLLALPGFTIPVMGLIAGIILFFLFAHTEFRETSQLAKETSSIKSFHHMNERILLGVLDDKNVHRLTLQLQEENVIRMFPESQGAIKDIREGLKKSYPDVFSRKDLLRKSYQLISLHQNLIRERGKLRDGRALQ